MTLYPSVKNSYSDIRRIAVGGLKCCEFLDSDVFSKYPLPISVDDF